MGTRHPGRPCLPADGPSPTSCMLLTSPASRVQYGNRGLFYSVLCTRYMYSTVCTCCWVRRSENEDLARTKQILEVQSCGAVPETQARLLQSILVVFCERGSLIMTMSFRAPHARSSHAVRTSARVLAFFACVHGSEKSLVGAPLLLADCCFRACLL